MTRDLEALDRKYGRVHTIEDARRIGEKSAETLTDDDLIVLTAFDPLGAPSKRRARDEAQRVIRKYHPTRAARGLKAEQIAECVVALLAPLAQRIEALEQRIGKDDKGDDT